MAHAQKPDFVFPRNGWVHINRRGRQFSRLLAAEVCSSAWVMLGRPRSEVAWEYWLPTPFTSFPFTSPPVRHRVPPCSERALQQRRLEYSNVFSSIFRNYATIKSIAHAVMCLIPRQCFKSVRQTVQENSSFIVMIYRVIQEEWSIFWEMIVSVIVRKNIHTNMYLSDNQDTSVGI